MQGILETDLTGDPAALLDVEFDTLLTPAEAARILRTTVQTMANWRVQGKGPPWVRLVGRRVFYRKIDLKAWIAAQVRNSAQAA
jgi:hypothetical protein